jgi:aspartate racemase
MKKIGLIGGTGWVSTREYYRIINETINERLGGLNAAECILYSFNYAQINTLNKRGDLEGVLALLIDAAARVEGAGADCLVLCANTLHYFAADLEKHIHIPLINIAVATAAEIKRNGLCRVGLLGTKMTMEADFYKAKLENEIIRVLTPELPDRQFIHATIMDELLKNVVSQESKQRFLEIINKLKLAGAEGIVLGCTEIPLLIKQPDIDLPLFDTLYIHSLAAVDFAIG